MSQLSSELSEFASGNYKSVKDMNGFYKSETCNDYNSNMTWARYNNEWQTFGIQRHLNRLS